MADIQAFLTKKAGPLPVWAWAAGAGGLASVLFLYKKGATAPSGPANPGTMFPQPSLIMTDSGTSNFNPPPAVRNGYRSGAAGTTVWNGHPYKWVITGPGQGPTDAAQAMNLGGSVGDQIGRLVYFTPNPMSDSQGNVIWFIGLTDTGQPLPAWGKAPWPPPYAGPVPAEANVSNTGGAGVSSTYASYVPNSGGGKVGRYNSPGVRPQFLEKMSLGAASKKTGAPMGRLMALNPENWKPVAGDKEVIRVG